MHLATLQLLEQKLGGNKEQETNEKEIIATKIIQGQSPSMLLGLGTLSFVFQLYIIRCMKKIQYAWLIESNFNGAFLYLMVKCVLEYTLNNLTKKEKF